MDEPIGDLFPSDLSIDDLEETPFVEGQKYRIKVELSPNGASEGPPDDPLLTLRSEPR
jgi:hypothetical protein